MATNHGHGNGAERNLNVEYDKSDLSAKGIVIFLVVLGVFALVINIAVIGLYAAMTRVADQHETETSPLASQTIEPRQGILMNTANVNTQQFPEPRLLRHLTQTGLDNRFVGEPGEMTKFLEQESAALAAQPWRDEHGNVHLPINQAMKEVVTRLPVRSGGTELPNYPGAARVYSYPSPETEAIQPGATSSGTETDETQTGETGNSSAGKQAGQ
ncbi:MAG: hypothetical protein WA532_13505 [Candidatus Korobacteraceae bacterium]